MCQSLGALTTVVGIHLKILPQLIWIGEFACVLPINLC